MRGEIRFETTASGDVAPRYIELLAEALREAQPSHLAVEGTSIELRCDLFHGVPNWNLLWAVTSARFHAEPDQGGIVVRFEASVTELLILCCLFTVVVYWLDRGDSTMRASATAVIVVWGFGFGVNYVLIRWRLMRLMRSIAKKL